MPEQKVKKTVKKAVKTRKVTKTAPKKPKTAAKSKTSKVIKLKTISKKKLEKSPEIAEVVVESTQNSNNSYIAIDYPFENETLLSNHHYAIRISTSNDGYAEVALDGGEWFRCRFNDGYWWFDWVNFSYGYHVLSARLVNPEGKIISQTNNRKCKF
ncbi:MAG: hypothetical protein LBU55_06140 [Elusimicrobiota bacterium]|jgi:hypothetical protein|nr:hypothetical protein [Elusimicrobiota bacterium]